MGGDRPALPLDDEVLIRVRAASVNPYDWHMTRGRPFVLRLGTGLWKPKSTRLGVDAAGEMEAVGRNVTAFKAGDRVFGAVRGAFAEYATTKEANLVLKPDSISFEQAATINMAGLTALQAVRDFGCVQSGQQVLINGAAGASGRRLYGSGLHSGVLSLRRHY